MKGFINMQLGDYIFEYSQRNKEDKSYPVYSVTNTLGFCQEYFSKDVSGKDKTTYKLVPRGYFAYNPSRINVGSVDWQKTEDCVIVSPLYVVFGLKDTLKPEYLKYYLKSKPTNELIKLSTSGTVRDNLKYSTLEKFPIPVPSIEEQTAICSLLDKLNLVIEKKKEQLKELDNLAQSIFYDMFGDPITNEKRWSVKKVIDVVKLQRGYDLPVQDRKQDGTIPIYGANGIVGYHTEAKAQYGIITGRSGSIGDVFMSKKPFWPLNTSLFSVDTNDNNIIYLMFLMRNYDLLRFKQGAGVPTLNRNSFHQNDIIDVPLSLQQSFAEKIEAIEHQKELINQSIQEVQTLFDSRMDYYFGD